MRASSITILKYQWFAWCHITCMRTFLPYQSSFRFYVIIPCTEIQNALILACEFLDNKTEHSFHHYPLAEVLWTRVHAHPTHPLIKNKSKCFLNVK